MKRVTIATIFLLISGASVTLLASIYLDSPSLILFIAYSAFVGIFTMVPSTAIEQYYSAAGFGIQKFQIVRQAEFWRQFFGFMIWCFLIFIIWTRANFTEHNFLIPAFIAGFLFACGSSIIRGILINNSNFRLYSMSHFLVAIAQIMVPLAFIQFGVFSKVQSLIIGQSIAWGAPFVLLPVIKKKGIDLKKTIYKNREKPFTKLLVLNFLIFLNLLSAQILVKFNFSLSASEIGSQFQIYLTYSRLITLISLGLMSLLIWNFRNIELDRSSRFLKMAYLAIFPLTTAGILFASVVIKFGRGQTSIISILVITLIGLSAAAFALAVVFSARAIALERTNKAVTGWLIGLLPTLLLFIKADFNELNFASLIFIQSLLILGSLRKIAE